MNAAKEEVLRILDRLPDDASLEDIQYHIYVRQKIDHGLEEIEAGRTPSEEEFDRRMADLIAEFERGQGPIPPELIEEVRQEWQEPKSRIRPDRQK
jgi:hypothetical protein